MSDLSEDVQAGDLGVQGEEVQAERGGLTRRGFLTRSAATAATVGAVGSLAGAATATGKAKTARKVPGNHGTVPLPSASQVRADYQRMVDFGPRLPGYEEHLEFCDWIEDEFVKAGLELLPTDQIPYSRWRPGAISLKVGNKTFDPATTYVRVPGTPPEGITAPLVVAGDGPVDGKIVLVEAAVPTPRKAGLFIAMADYWQWRGHTAFEGAAEEFDRFAFSDWPSIKPYADQGAKAVLFISRASRAEVEGNWSPHQAGVQPIPGLVLDRDMGAELKALAASQPDATLKLEADWKDTYVPQITGILPGESDEVLVVNSHTDGQNAFEENGAVALVHMARHFASLRGSEKLKRTIVFLAWPGHMAIPTNRPEDRNTLPEQFGWFTSHRDLFDRTVAAVTVEHLGATRWADDPEKGYHDTGMSDFYAIWTTLGAMQDLCKVALKKSDLQRHALLRPPVQVTPGVAWHHRGIPHVAGISAPKYLVRVSENGDMDKLDAELAARQTAFYADVVKLLDSADPEALLAGGEGDDSFNSVSDRFYPMSRARSGPARKVVFDAGEGRRLAIYIGGRAARDRDIGIQLAALDRPLEKVTVAVYRDDTFLGKSQPTRAERKVKRIAVHRRGHRADHRNLHRNRSAAKFRDGTYTIVVRQDGKLLGQRNVTFRRQR